MKFSIKDFFIKCDQIRRKMRVWSRLLKKSLMGNFIFCVVMGQVIKFGTKQSNQAKLDRIIKPTANALFPGGRLGTGLCVHPNFQNLKIF